MTGDHLKDVFLARAMKDLNDRLLARNPLHRGTYFVLNDPSITDDELLAQCERVHKASVSNMSWFEIWLAIAQLKQKIRTELDPAKIQAPCDLAAALEYTENLILEFGQVHGERMRALDPDLEREWQQAWNFRSHGWLRCFRALAQADYPKPDEPLGDAANMTVADLVSQAKMLSEALTGFDVLASNGADADLAQMRSLAGEMSEIYAPLRQAQLVLEQLRALREDHLDLVIRLDILDRERARPCSD